MGEQFGRDSVAFAAQVIGWPTGQGSSRVPGPGPIVPWRKGLLAPSRPVREPIAAAEARAAQTYWDSVEAQCKANAVPITRLSQRAEAAVAALAVAPDDKARAALWRSATAVMALGP